MGKLRQAHSPRIQPTAASLPPRAFCTFLVQEGHWIDTPDLWRNWVKEGEIIDKGYITLPDRAGLGVEMNEEGARKAQVPGTPWFEPAARG